MGGRDRGTKNGKDGGDGPARKLVSLREASERCGVSQSTVRRWIRSGKPGFPIPVLQGGPSTGPVTDERGATKQSAGGRLLQFWLHEVEEYLDTLPRYQPPGTGR